ncbi:MAG: hypothetical protein ACOX5W_13580 [Bacillota bacterium]|jgi:hypothetical protein
MKINRKWTVTLTLAVSLILILGFSFNAIAKNASEKSSTRTVEVYDADDGIRTIEVHDADGIRTIEVYNADYISEKPPTLTLAEAESVINNFVEADQRGDIDSMMKYCLDVRGSVGDQRKLYEILHDSGPSIISASAKVISVKEIPVDQLRERPIFEDENISFKEIPIEEVPVEVIEAQNHPERINREVLREEDFKEILKAQKQIEDKISEKGTIWVADVDIELRNRTEDQLKFLHHNGEWKIYVTGH